MADFTVLTRLLRETVDDRLAARLTVTGWRDGVLRVLLDQPALATRWRFQEPAARRALARKPALAGLREIRLAMTRIPGHPPRQVAPADPASLRAAPLRALRELADTEGHLPLRQALLRLVNAAEKARQGKSD